MKNIQLLYSIFISCFIFNGIASSALYLPVNQNEFKLLYETARREEISGQFYNFNFNIAPYNFERLESSIPFIDVCKSVSTDKLKLFAIPSENFRSIKDSTPIFNESIRAGFFAQPMRNFQVYSNFILDESIANDPDYTGKKYRGLAGEVENAYIAYSNKKIELLFGRYSSFWGPTSNPVVLSSTARPMDAFSFRFNWGKLNYSYQLARLSRYTEPVSDTDFVIHDRYFAGHRIDIRIFDNFNLGFFETIIFSGPGRGLDLAYLNPLLFYHSFQLNENSDENTFLGIDFCWYLQNKHKIYGQLMIDDFQVDDKEQGDKEPDEVGYIFGFQTIDLFDFVDIQAEYLKITNRTFNQVKPANRYVNRGGLIGNDLGPDGDRLEFTISKWFNSYRKLAIGFAYQRKGEGRFDAEWDTPWMESIGDYSEPFPTGIVEKATTLHFNFTAIFKDILFIDLTTGLENISNSQNIRDNDFSSPFLDINLSLGLSTLFDMD